MYNAQIHIILTNNLMCFDTLLPFQIDHPGPGPPPPPPPTPRNATFSERTVTLTPQKTVRHAGSPQTIMQ